MPADPLRSINGRERVVRQYDPRGVLCASFVWGVFLGVVLIPALEHLNNWLGPRSQLWAVTVSLSLVILSYTLVPLLLARVAHRAKYFVWSAMVMNVGAFVATIALGYVRDLGFGATWWRKSPNPEMFVAFGITTGIAVAAALTTRWLFHRLRYVPVEQTAPARLCFGCAYEMGEADPCPECGGWRSGTRPRGAWLDSGWMVLQRWSRLLLVVMLLAFTGYSGWRVKSDLLPTLRFLSRFDTGDNAAYAYIDEYLYTDGVYAPAIGRTIDLNDGTGRMILVSFNAAPPAHLPMMQVRICAPATLPPGWPTGAERMTDWGTPGTIVSRLDRDQTEWVLRDGLPRGLIDAIVAKADEVGWKAWGGMHPGGGQAIVIDPASYFSAGPPAQQQSDARAPQ